MRDEGRGVIFDLDGTLVLSHHDFARMQEAAVRIAIRWGAQRDRLSLTERVGTSEVVAHAHAELERMDPGGRSVMEFDGEFARAIDSLEMEALERTVPRNGADRLLRALAAAGFRLAVFTRSSRSFTREVLRRLRWTELFPYLRTRSDPGPAKPSEAALPLLMDEMGLSAEQVDYVGDHPEDARCAAALGVAFYAVLPDPENPNPATEDEFRSLGAADVVPSLDDLLTTFRIVGTRTRRRFGEPGPRPSARRAP
jgi:N-acetyl-D-muramate 6-phosphate phosphatase